MFTKVFIRLSAGKKIAYLSIFTAALVLINTFSIDLSPQFKLSFTAAAAFLTGAMFGAFGGFSVCAIGDLIGCFFSGYPPNPLILIATGFLGFIPGIVMTYIKSNFYFKVILSFIICSLVCTAGLNTLGIYLYYSSRSVPFFAYMIARFPLQLPVMAVNCVLAIVLSKIINKTSFPFKIN